MLRWVPTKGGEAELLAFPRSQRLDAKWSLCAAVGTCGCKLIARWAHPAA
jgi:hypothetical protein